MFLLYSIIKTPIHGDFYFFENFAEMFSKWSAAGLLHVGKDLNAFAEENNIGKRDIYR